MNFPFLVREYSKSALRNGLRRANLGIVRGPYEAQVVRAVRWLGVDTVLDVGANIGQFGDALFSSGFEGRVISFEPLSDAFRELDRRSTRHGADWIAVNAALGSANGAQAINVSANSYSSSILTVTHAHLRADARSGAIGTEQVSVTTVDVVVETYAVRPASTLLKVDTQGYESAVLNGAAATLGSFAAVQLELSLVCLYDTQDLFEDLTARMAGAGFTLFGLNPGISDPTTGRLLQADGLFVARDRLPAR